MSRSKKQRFLKLMRLETVLPADMYRENLSGTPPQELLSLLSFPEFNRLVEELKAGCAVVQGHNS